MDSLCMFLLEAWYTDVRKSVPATVSKRVNNGIRSFANASPETSKAVKLAKMSGAALDAKRRRKDVASALKHGHRRGSSIVHSPSRKPR